MSLKTANSPFLRAHQDNPVAWRVWGDAALAEAKAQDKPILLSLGLHSSALCHRMNKESFSDAETAGLINDNFIPVLTDRDDRPDLDLLFQGAAGAMGHTGGWPVNIFLTPDGVPFWAAGYQPVEDQLDIPSFKRVLRETADLYRNRKDQVAETVARVRDAVEYNYNRDMRLPETEGLNVDMAAVRIGQNYDIFFGGLTGGTKFLNPPMIEVLWRAWLRTGTQQFSQLVFTTLDGILFGGAYDHVGGGFFRYATDERWFEPHFEKTLYDNAQMLELCIQIWQFNRNELCRARVAETVAFLLRDMKADGGFANTILPGAEGEEGKYYLWSEAEIDAALVGTFSARFKQVYGVSRDGNYGGRNLLRRLGNPQPPSEADEALLTRQRDMLLEVRGKRPAPARDERVLADMNGLAIAAIARAGIVFEKQEWIDAAIAAFDHVVKTLGKGDHLSHAAKGGQGFADDYANMARAALQLWEVTGEERFQEKARAWVKTLNGEFWNAEKGGYAFTSSSDAPLFVRPRMLFENPAPPANGTMLTVLTRLALITGDVAYMERASTLGVTFGDEASRVLNGSGAYINGFEYVANALMIVVIGKKKDAATQALLRAFWSKPVPNGILIQLEPNDPLPPAHPLTGRGLEDGKPTAYICQRGECSAPITSPEQLALQLTLPLQLQQQIAQQQS